MSTTQYEMGDDIARGIVDYDLNEFDELDPTEMNIDERLAYYATDPYDDDEWDYEENR